MATPNLTPPSAFLRVGSDVSLHLQTLDLLSAATGSRIYVFDRAGRYLYVSEAGASILGLTPAAMIEKSIFELNFPPESSQRLACDLNMVFEAGIAATGENWITTSHGPRNCAYTLHPLKGVENEVSAVAVTVMDITARKQAEEELRRKQEEAEALNAQLRRAITETHHRVKNNLQLIAAMIDMRAMQSPDSLEDQIESVKAAVYSVSDLRRLSGCVRALAVVHDILTHESKSDARNAFVSVRPLLLRLLPLLEETLQAHRIQSHIENARLSVHHSTALALILNELVSNALKHGRGSVDVTFRVETRCAFLTIADDGPGFPAGFDAARAANTGLELIDTLTRHDLGGTVEYANRPEGGGRVTVAMPLPDKQP